MALNLQLTASGGKMNIVVFKVKEQLRDLTFELQKLKNLSVFFVMSYAQIESSIRKFNPRMLIFNSEENLIPKVLESYPAVSSINLNKIVINNAIEIIKKNNQIKQEEV